MFRNIPNKELFCRWLRMDRAWPHHGHHHALEATLRECPLWVDAVDKVGDEQRAGNNRIQLPSFLNRYCAPDSYLDSMLLTSPSKKVYRQHRLLTPQHPVEFVR
jgi:hypothetical protein